MTDDDGVEFTENLTGFRITGDYLDLERLVDALHT